jgi:hypothetical protein
VFAYLRKEYEKAGVQWPPRDRFLKKKESPSQMGHHSPVEAAKHSALYTHDDPMLDRLVAIENTSLSVVAQSRTNGQGLTLVRFSAQPEPFLTQAKP